MASSPPPAHVNPTPAASLEPQDPAPGSWRARANAWFARIVRSTRRTDDLLAGIPDRIDGLLHFGQETDREFSAMALGLGELTQHLDRMRQRAGDLDAILHDRDQDRALQSTHGLCKSAIELVHASLGTSHALQGRMCEADTSLVEAVAVREDFEKNFMMLRTLSMAIRIEAARVSSEFQGVFSHVAGAIREIDEKIATSTGRAFDRIEALVGETAVDRDGLLREETALYQQAKESIDLVQHDIDTLRRGLAPCAEALQQVSRLLESTVTPRTAILSSLQYQDIVRQKLEHVATGFRDITQHSHDRVFLHRAATLQQTHLASAREEITTAGGKATGGLDTLLQVGRQIDTLLQTVESTAVTALGRSRMDEIVGRELLHLAHIANRSAETNRRIAARVERIEAVVRVFSGDVTGHQREVKLVALNAQIAAARLSSGGALEKLAEAASHVAQRNAETTTRLTAHLQRTLERLVLIKGEADDFLATMTRDKAALEAGAATVDEKLIRHRQAIQDQSRTVRTEFAGVREGTRALLARIRFPVLIEGCFGAAERTCRDLAERTATSLATSSLSLAGARRFHDHLRRYTMEEERAAHEAVLGGRPATTSSPELDAVELFDSTSTTEPAANREEPPPPPTPPAADESEADANMKSKARSATTVATKPATSPRPETTPDLGDGIELF